MTKIYIYKNIDDASDFCAKFLINAINKKPQLVLGLATGTSFMETYTKLKIAYENKKVSFKQIHTFNLDEYKGCKGDEPWSYRHFMNQQLFLNTDFNLKNTYFPDAIHTSKLDLQKYDEKLRKMPIDIQLLGIGRNGHIAFNEPSEKWTYQTHLVNLHDETIADNARLFFKNNLTAVPKQAVTMGIEGIISAKQILLTAFGTNKSDAIQRYIADDKIDPELPISCLHDHSDVIMVIDKECASNINWNNLAKDVKITNV